MKEKKFQQTLRQTRKQGSENTKEKGRKLMKTLRQTRKKGNTNTNKKKAKRSWKHKDKHGNGKYKHTKKIKDAKTAWKH